MTEWNAREYHRQSSLQKWLADEQLARLTVVGTERILDIGCGDGKVTAALAARVPRGAVVGIDPSRDMIDFAVSHFGVADLPNLRFEVADARQLPFQGEFDLVVSFNALHWVTDQAAALRSIRAALKPHGRTLLQFVPAGDRKSLEHVIADTSQAPRWASRFEGYRQPFVHFTPEAYRALATANGLRVVHIGTMDKAWDFGTHEAFTAFCRATFVEWTRRLAESERDDFIADVLHQYRLLLAAPAGEDNVFRFYQMEVVLTPA